VVSGKKVLEKENEKQGSETSSRRPSRAPHGVNKKRALLDFQTARNTRPMGKRT